ncbi:MAG: hypothetical protein L6Q31_05970 [Fimbriimonadaceae bacterium]|nr:hypothetical protein [Fimbriimonadaceae bacterium]NUM38591.1 hypothetical protein [Armatimonadota bacterium]
MTPAAPRVSSVRLVWSPDFHCEPDYLETSAESHFGKDGSAWSHVSEADKLRVESEFGSIWNACLAYSSQDAERLTKFRSDEWWFQGCYAVAEVLYESSPGCFRLDELRSAGLWGIESDSSSDYLRSVESDELADLSSHLKRFGIHASVDELAALVTR